MQKIIDKLDKILSEIPSNNTSASTFLKVGDIVELKKLVEEYKNKNTIYYYTENEVLDICAELFGEDKAVEKFKKFDKWMTGQTMPLIKCYYCSDVNRFIRNKIKNKE